jgi:hypothetical protein
MTEAHSKSRQRAEIAFTHLQTQFFSKKNAIEELDALVEARDAKTLRLREARLSKELADSISTPSLITKRVKAR